MKTNKLFTVLIVVALLLGALGAFIALQPDPPAAFNSQYLGETTAQSLTLNDKLVTSSQSYTLTAGQLITPTKSLYVLSASGAVSMTLAPCSSATSKFIVLYGDDNQTITVNDTNIYTTDGNAVTLGQYDVVGFHCVGTKWSLTFKSANS